MFKAVGKASAEIYRTLGRNRTDLGTITRAVESVTAIDKVVFVEYESSPNNPIWGSFQKYVRRPSPYTSIETWVEIRYASHLDTTWRRFVVCKELCHALEEDDGCHSVSPSAMDALVNSFSLGSKRTIEEAKQTTPPIAAESLAEAAALELLCPMPIRREVEARGLEDHTEVCAEWGIPYEYGWFAFGKRWIDAMDGFIRG
nr:Unknown Function [uncultured bacterium]